MTMSQSLPIWKNNMLPPLKPIPIKDRLSMIFLSCCQVDVKNGAFVSINEHEERTHIPVGDIACVLLEPGTRVTHAAAALAAATGTLLIWIGEAGVRLYAAGQPGGARSDHLLYQAKLALDETARLKVVREMYKQRFGSEPPAKRSVDQLRGIEGSRVKTLYQQLAKQYRVDWHGRDYDIDDWHTGDIPNRCLSVANHCLYGVCEAAILAAGYAPAIGFIHTGKPLSFVYDIADIYKFDTVVPVAFKIAGQKNPTDLERRVRHACRDSFRQSKLLQKIIPDIENLLAAGGLEKPAPAAEAVGPAIPNPEGTGDAGHRS